MKNIGNVSGKEMSPMHVAIVILCLSVLVCILRYHTYSEPFERDIASHAVIGSELFKGRLLYADLWDNKPPAIYITYGLFNLVAGMGPLSVYLLGVMAAIVTLIGIYKAGCVLGGRITGMWTAVFWTLIGSDLWMWANQPNIEAFINACIVWALVLMLSSGIERIESTRWLLIGLLFALATLYKPVAIVFAVFLSVGYVLGRFKDGRELTTSLMRIGLAALAGMMVWFSVIGYFAITDRFEVFYNTIFKYGEYYAKSRGGNLLSNLAEGFTFNRLFDKPMQSAAVLGVFSVAGLIAGFLRGHRKTCLLLSMFLLAVPLAVSLPGRFYAHYYQLWLVPLVIGGGWLIAVSKTGKERTTSLLRNIMGALGVMVLLAMVAPQYKYSADEWSALKYGPQFVENKKVAEFISGILKPQEIFFVWGINPELYFWARQSPPTGVIWSTDMMEGPLARIHTERALQDLQRTMPDLFIINSMQVKTPKDHPVIRWALDNYVPLFGDKRLGLFFIMARQNSDIIRRVQAAR